MTEKQIQNIIIELRNRASKAKRKCLFDRCESNAIDSHLLQKRGLIDQIAENNKVWELAVVNYKTSAFSFKQTGINVVFTFPGFCDLHDNQLFKEIEAGDIEYTNYRTQLLFSYRAIANEKRKKEILLDFYNRILSSASLQHKLSPKYLENIKLSAKATQDGINDEIHYEKDFLANIQDNSKRDFCFLTFEVPFVEICSSAVFTYETSGEINKMVYAGNPEIENPLTEIYFNLLPIKDKSIVIMGCQMQKKEKCWEYINSFNTGNPDKSLKKISDLLLCQVENWITSENFYKNNLRTREKEIIGIVEESCTHENERRELNFNLFETKS